MTNTGTDVTSMEVDCALQCARMVSAQIWFYALRYPNRANHTYILELDAGDGPCASIVLTHVYHAMTHGMLPSDVSFTYIIADTDPRVVQRVSSCTGYDLFKSKLMLDFAVFDPKRDAELHLMLQETTLAFGSLSNTCPLIVLCNGALSQLPADRFLFKDGIVYASALEQVSLNAVHGGDPTVDPHRGAWVHREIVNGPTAYYKEQNAVLGQCLKAIIPDSKDEPLEVSVPVGIVCLFSTLKTWQPLSMTVVSFDDTLNHVQPNQTAVRVKGHHLSWPVNNTFLQNWMARSNGHVSSSVSSAFTLSIYTQAKDLQLGSYMKRERQNIDAVTCASEDGIHDHSRWDLNAWVYWIRSRDCQPLFVLTHLDDLCSAAAHAVNVQQNEALEDFENTLEQIASHSDVLDQRYEIEFALGRCYSASQRCAQAQQWFERSEERHGLRLHTSLAIARCALAQKHYNVAKGKVWEALDMDPACEEANVLANILQSK